ncbi:ScbR family autoregulator-binding transcription factor [Streptomyces sp. DSM 41886]|uniref:ScbR family autoregulator-binding transcription factor n=1 Tax=Streptomyces johnsoniae TaxID=3075532 RepID=A0ABU2S825_9ACTN|nr:ScbR family autoregulator-binding transcription factor [Streptomyces sp. DSM 41886]MDT0444245.1 ScbR family autoregulator-binding transcription factor [Streptomyces sp. DSM 41886]
MARQARAILKRRVILEAAASVFNEYGYGASTIAQILERAAVTRGALYFHFCSKEALARSVLAEAVTTEGVRPQPLKLQEFVDVGLLLAHRLPREPLLSASLRLSVDQNARTLFGTRWPDWIEVAARLLQAGQERGEVLPHIIPAETGRIFIGAWTGVGLVSETLDPVPELTTDIAKFFDLLLPSIAVPSVLIKLDTSPGRVPRLLRAAGEG